MKVRRIGLILSIILALAANMLPTPVFALTQDRAINAEGSQTGGTYVGGAGTFANLNSDDDNTTYLHQTGPATIYHCFDMVNFATAASSITSVTTTGKIFFSGGVLDYCTYRAYVRISGTNYYGSYETIPTSYQYFTEVWVNNPSTGTAWTTAAINAAEWGFEVSTATTADMRITYFKITIDYVPATAPVVTTSAASGILYDGAYKATLNGAVTDDGGGTIDLYGFVWDTVDEGNPGNVDPSTPPGAWASGWKSAAGDYGENSFSHQITGLIKNTTYYFRAAAHNAVGWSYGTAQSFTTLTDPTVSTSAATNVVTTTATLNGILTFDGRYTTGCAVTFVYKSGTGYANYAAILAAGGTETAASGTYTTGTYPSKGITGLTASTTYSFAVKAVNSVSTAYGSVLTFTTESGVYAPTNFGAIPQSTNISLSWTKGTGAAYTLIRYAMGTYPTVIGEGTSAYFGTGNSYQLTGLTSGRTYYFSAWGYTGGTYSAAYTTVVTTTSAYTAGGSSLETPKADSSWVQTPDETKISNLPLLPGLVESNSDAYGVPLNMIWYFLWIMFAAGVGIVLYNKGNYNLTLAIGVTSLIIGGGAALGLTMLWILFGFLVVAGGFAFFGERR